MRPYPDDISLVIEGAAGQGVQTITAALLPILNNSGYNVFSCMEYMSRIRGGRNSTEIRITGKIRRAFTAHIDVLFALSPHAFEHLQNRIDEKTLIFAEKEQFGNGWNERCIDTPIAKFAIQAGGPVYSNTVAAGAVLGILGIPLEPLNIFLREQFAIKGDEAVENNIKAATLGYDFGLLTPPALKSKIPLPSTNDGESHLLMDGNTALGIGAIAAGCNFICSYPMSPGTGLLSFLAERSGTFGIVVDQAEDEIAAINAGLGASYAGARAVVTTSGGGFDLMQEGMSLAGMIETPIVVHIGQRPGPATGLPTRTEQGDLDLALHAGHGDFARAIFAPGTLEETIATMQQAFDLAQRFQIPVIVLTDQYLLDAVSTIDVLDIKRLPVASTIVRTDEKYKRYAFTDDGLSPRGVPGYGDGLVRVDSDEHDEQGLITESFDMRSRMMEKRLKRLQPLAEEAFPPTVIGRHDGAEIMIVCWGSTRGVLEEALDILDSKRLAGIHFSQVYPLNPSILAMLRNRRIIVIENNARGQFADLLTHETGLGISRRILKATGEPFSVEEVVDALQEEAHG
ncbi:MAG: 2-oxoacid:acceptor oxidoreductase subunit alpha [Chlorobiaceae bacterium]|nr:2-oxoacid:acceptor oxidoreductase subunit alpha [Chlorobiaceae bacterium]